MHPVIQLLFNILAGSGLLTYGVHLLSRTMEGFFQAQIPKAVQRMNDSAITAFWLSVALTALVQSSSTITVLTVGLADSGFLSLTTAMAVVYGANIGTTVTAQMMSLDIASYGLVILIAGTVIFLLGFLGSRRAPQAYERIRFFAVLIIALGIVFSGLTILKSSAGIIKSSPFILEFINQYRQSLLCCLFFGLITTAIIQSSSATVGITMALLTGGIIDLPQAIAIMLGDNIGTCATAQIAALFSSANGRRVAWGHSIYNMVCALLLFQFIDRYALFIQWMTSALHMPEAYYLANAHTLFNIAGAFLFLPMNRLFCALLSAMITDGCRGYKAMGL